MPGPTAVVPVWVNRGSLKLPVNPRAGIICVGPVSGLNSLALMRSNPGRTKVLRWDDLLAVGTADRWIS